MPLALAGLLLTTVLSTGCDEPRRRPLVVPRPGPIVLITLEGLRPDVVGGLGGDPRLTPALSAWIEKADWAGRAVAPSSWLTPSFASLMTGLKPWQHQAITALEPQMAGDLVTLAEALKSLGYRTRAYHDSDRLSANLGCVQGIDRVFALRRGQRAAQDIANLRGGRELVWVHLTLPAPPYVRRDYLLPRIAPAPEGLPQRLGGNALEQYFDPATPMPAAVHDRLWALYRLNVAAADALLGRLLAGLGSDERGDGPLVAIVSLFGQEFGEQGQVGSGGNLGRSEIEVPLILKLPRSLAGQLAVPAGERVAVARLWATLVSAAGGQPPPGVAPSLFGPGESGELSELYHVAGSNEFSWLEGDLQLRWVQSFADPGRDYYPLRMAAMAAARGSAARESYRERLLRLDRTFRLTLPLSGNHPPVLLLERWTADGVESVDDPTRQAEMAAHLRHAWLEGVGEESAPNEQSARRWR